MEVRRERSRSSDGRDRVRRVTALARRTRLVLRLGREPSDRAGHRWDSRGGRERPDVSEVSGKPWNDIVVDDRGNAYVNTIGFDFPGGEFAPGMVVLVTPKGTVGRVADDLAFPNGMAITADGRTLIVAESYAERLTAFDIGEDGGLGSRRVWAETPGDHPDGVCMDAEGAVWYADVGNQHCVRVREGGEVLATVDLDRGAFACALSRGEDPRLFVVGQNWGGPESSEPSGRVVAFPAPAPGAG